MSNKPKSWLPLPGKAASEAEIRAARHHALGVRVLQLATGSLRQGAKPARIIEPALRHAACILPHKPKRKKRQ